MVKTSDVTCTVHDLEVMGSNPDWIKLEAHSSSVLVKVEPNISVMSLCSGHLCT